MAILESDNYKETFTFISPCPGLKNVTQYIEIDDGTGKIYQYQLSDTLEWVEYTITPDFTTDPIKPTITDETDIIPNIGDLYDIVETEGIDYDLNEDGEILNINEDEIVTHILSTPREQIIKQTVRYFTGWEIKTDYIEKTIYKTNIAPLACNTQEMSCFTVPTAIYTSCSTDQEDNPETLQIDWELYLDTNSYIDISYEDDGTEIRTVIYDPDDTNYELQTSKLNNPIFSWTYNNEGHYLLKEIATDTDGASSEALRELDIVFKACIEDVQKSIQASGIIEVEANVWQLCAIPMTTGYWDKDLHKIVYDDSIKSTIKNVIIDQIEDVYNRPASELIKVINGYTGDENEFRNYIPGFTKETSIHNFQLVYTDDDMDIDDDITKFEISGFWIKSLDTNFEIKWGVE